MILRILNLLVICALVMAAAYVYRIKFDSTVQAERLAKIRGEVRRERDAIAGLRAEWSELDSPARIQALAKRYLPLKPVAPTQFDTLNQLPERPPQFIKPDSPDPIGAAHREAGGARRADRKHSGAGALRGLPTIRTRRDEVAKKSRRGKAGGSTDERDGTNRGPGPPIVWRRLVQRLLYGTEDRPRRQGARAGRPGDPAFARGLLHHRGAPRHVRRGFRRPHRASCRYRRRHRDRAAGHSRSQRRSAGDRRARALALRRAAPADRRRRSGGDADRRSARSRRRRTARAAVVEARLRLAQTRYHARAAARDLSPGPARHRLSQREQARLSERPPKSRTSSATSISTTRASPAWRSGSTATASPRCTWRGLPPTGCKIRCSSAVDLRVQHALRDELVAARAKFKAIAAAGIVLDVRTGEVVAMVSEPDYDPEQSAPGARSDAHQPADHRRVRDGIDLQGVHHRDGAQLRQGHAEIVVRRAHAAAFRQVRHSRFPPAEPRAHGAGNLHLFLEHRRGARRARGRRRRAQGVPEENWDSSTGCAPNCPESAEPIVPKRWGELNTITIAFGHGLSVAPLQAVMGVAALMNGGILIPPTFLKRTEEEATGARQTRHQARN